MVDNGQDTCIGTLKHDSNDVNFSTKGGSVYFNDFVWISTRVTFSQGVRIGRGAVVACGSIVTKDVLPYEIVAGVPAKKMVKGTEI